MAARTASASRLIPDANLRNSTGTDIWAACANQSDSFSPTPHLNIFKNSVAIFAPWLIIEQCESIASLSERSFPESWSSSLNNSQDNRLDEGLGEVWTGDDFRDGVVRHLEILAPESRESTGDSCDNPRPIAA